MLRVLTQCPVNYEINENGEEIEDKEELENDSVDSETTDEEMVELPSNAQYKKEGNERR